MSAFRLAASDRGLMKNGEFTGYALFNNGQSGTGRLRNFGPVYVFNDDTLFPNSFLEMHPHKNVEIVTIMISGEESHKDTLGAHENYIAGDVQLISAGRGLSHAGGNTSSIEASRHLQIWIDPRTHDTSSHVQVLKTIGKGSRNTNQKLIVSPDGEDGTLKINQNVWISKLYLKKNETYTVCTHNKNNGLLIYVLDGSVTIAATALQQGDSIFIDEWYKTEIHSFEEESLLVLIETKLV